MKDGHAYAAGSRAKKSKGKGTGKGKKKLSKPPYAMRSMMHGKR